MPAQTVTVTLLQVGRSPRRLQNALLEKFPLQTIVLHRHNGKYGARLIASPEFLGDICDELIASTEFPDGRQLGDMTVWEMFPRHILVEQSLLTAVYEVLNEYHRFISDLRTLRNFVIRDSFDMVIAT